MMSDLPRAELLKRADLAIARYGGPYCVQVFFKFTCEKCGERVMFMEPNKLPERGVCHLCGHTTPVQRGGFALDIDLRKGGEKTR